MLLPVFVYGTLKKGFGNHALLTEAYYKKRRGQFGVGKDDEVVIEDLGEVAVDGYTLVDLGYFPGAVPDDKSVIKGEAYRVSPVVLRRLDRLEGAPDMYRREVGWACRENGESFPVMLYVWNGFVPRDREIGQEWVGRARVPAEISTE